MNGGVVDKLVAEVFQEIKFDTEDVEIAYLAAKEKIIQQSGTKNVEKYALEKKLKESQQQMTNLVKVISTDPQMVNALKPQILSLEAEIKEILPQLSNFNEQTIVDVLRTLEQVKNTFLRACTGSFDYLNSNDDQKFELIKILLWNLKIEDQKIKVYQLKKPYQLMAQAPKKMDLNEWLATRV